MKEKKEKDRNIWIKKWKELHPVQKILDSEALECLKDSRARKIIGMDIFLILLLFLVLIIVNITDSSVKTSGKTKENADTKQTSESQDTDAGENTETVPENALKRKNVKKRIMNALRLTVIL